MRGFDAIPQLYSEMRARNPGFELAEQDLNTWGYRLIQRGDRKAAIAVLKLATTLFPKSFNAYDSLAEAYQADDNKPLAIADYRRSLEIIPAQPERHRSHQGDGGQT